ncbi:DUF6415 family natural product biosynthesis protein [Streptomyces sp. NPDC093984]|uniref:DUF6415 family natural product biosynthesis protein n=1 Tax=Streptomyces sp. NPDC093984 TaxID=3366052 RepID=UPI003806A90D
MTSEKAPIDAQRVRETYDRVLWGPSRPHDAELDKLQDLLTGHVQLLIPEVTEIAARMRGEWRRTAVHVLVRAHHLLENGPGNSPATKASHAYDLAISARALLALHQNPGPLGQPTGKGEIEEAVHRRVCGVCSEPIKPGQPYERADFEGEAGGAIRGYRHTEPCTDDAEAPRERLHLVERAQ